MGRDCYWAAFILENPLGSFPSVKEHWVLLHLPRWAWVWTYMMAKSAFRGAGWDDVFFTVSFQTSELAANILRLDKVQQEVCCSMWCCYVWTIEISRLSLPAGYLPCKKVWVLNVFLSDIWVVLGMTFKAYVKTRCWSKVHVVENIISENWIFNTKSDFWNNSSLAAWSMSTF